MSDFTSGFWNIYVLVLVILSIALAAEGELQMVEHEQHVARCDHRAVVVYHRSR